MARKRDRAIAWMFASVFLLSSVALTIGVIYQMFQDRNKPTKPNSNSTNAKEIKVDGPKLQGTALAGFTPLSSIAKLESIDSTAGTGAAVKASDTITVDYTGAIASTGIIFESSKDGGQPATFPLSGVIPGWTQGIPGMKEGGTRRLLIPASLAYGANGNASIPPNSDLVFDVTVHSISK